MFHVKHFQEATGVSGPVMERLTAYAELLEKWQRKINLVGPATIPDLWRRHMLDSAQLYPLLPRPDCAIIDFGSGAGFPGLVLAVMGGPRVTLVESDGRKCAFLAEAARLTGAADMVRIENRRIEDLPVRPVDVVTARALAPLGRLLEMAEPFIGENTVCLFPKGRKADQELTDAAKNWIMEASGTESETDASGTILRLTDISRRNG